MYPLIDASIVCWLLAGTVAFTTPGYPKNPDGPTYRIGEICGADRKQHFPMMHI
jgi:hypothetical protein